LSELFDIEICKNPISKDFALENPGNTPYITTTSENNGIECYVNYPPQYESGLITVSKDGGNGDAFLQQLPFCGNEKVMVLTPKQKLSKMQLFYYVTVIKFNKIMFGYGRKCSVARLGDLHIPTPKEIPSFVYDLKVEPITTKNKSNGASKLQVEKWQEFKVSELFRIEPTKGKISDDLIEGNDIPYIGAKHDLNGLIMHCQKEGFEEWVSSGNCIVFIQLGAGSAGYANYIESDFIGMSGKTSCGYIDGVMNKYIGLFLATILCSERPKYSFGRSWTGERLNDTVIKLPIQRNIGGTPVIDKTYRYSKNGYIPDWEFMESYIKALPYGDRI